MEKLTFRKIVLKTDKISIEKILRRTHFFHEQEIEIALSLFDEYKEKGISSGYNFLFLLLDNSLIGYSCYGPIPGTKNSYDLYWIAVDISVQNRGLGKTLLQATEKLVKESGGKKLYVETSSTSKYLPTQKFYEKNGFFLEAIQKAYYNDDDDKLLYVKTLTKE